MKIKNYPKISAYLKLSLTLVSLTLNLVSLNTFAVDGPTMTIQQGLSFGTRNCSIYLHPGSLSQASPEELMRFGQRNRYPQYLVRQVRGSLEAFQLNQTLSPPVYEAMAPEAHNLRLVDGAIWGNHPEYRRQNRGPVSDGAVKVAQISPVASERNIVQVLNDIDGTFHNTLRFERGCRNYMSILMRYPSMGSIMHTAGVVEMEHPFYQPYRSKAGAPAH